MSSHLSTRPPALLSTSQCPRPSPFHLPSLLQSLSQEEVSWRPLLEEETDHHPYQHLHLDLHQGQEDQREAQQRSGIHQRHLSILALVVFMALTCLLPVSLLFLSLPDFLILSLECTHDLPVSLVSCLTTPILPHATSPPHSRPHLHLFVCLSVFLIFVCVCVHVVCPSAALPTQGPYVYRSASQLGLFWWFVCCMFEPVTPLAGSL